MIFLKDEWHPEATKRPQANVLLSLFLIVLYSDPKLGTDYPTPLLGTALELSVITRAHSKGANTLATLMYPEFTRQAAVTECEWLHPPAPAVGTFPSCHQLGSPVET